MKSSASKENNTQEQHETQATTVNGKFESHGRIEADEGSKTHVHKEQGTKSAISNSLEEIPRRDTYWKKNPTVTIWKQGKTTRPKSSKSFWETPSDLESRKGLLIARPQNHAKTYQSQPRSVTKDEHKLLRIHIRCEKRIQKRVHTICYHFDLQICQC